MSSRGKKKMEYKIAAGIASATPENLKKMINRMNTDEYQEARRICEKYNPEALKRIDMLPVPQNNVKLKVFGGIA